MKNIFNFYSDPINLFSNSRDIILMIPIQSSSCFYDQNEKEMMEEELWGGDESMDELFIEIWKNFGTFIVFIY